MREVVVEVDQSRSPAERIRELKASGVRVRQRLGRRLLALSLDEDAEIPPGTRRVDQLALDLDPNDPDTLALAAWQLRQSPLRAEAKALRPHDGVAWDSQHAPDVPGTAFTGTVATDLQATGTATRDRARSRPHVFPPSVPDTSTRRSALDSPDAAASRTSAPLLPPRRLINEVAVGLLFVGAPADSPYAISTTDRVNAIADAQDALDWYADQEPDAQITWSVDITTSDIDIEPFAGANWPGLPEEWYGGADGTGAAGIDAAVWRSSNGAIYFFRGAEYVRFSDVEAGVDAGFPKPIAGNWHGLPSSFTTGIDAAFWRESNDKIYFFKGDQYVRIEPSTATMDAGYPQPILGNWVGLPSDFTVGIDAALMRRDNHKIYFFKGDEYVRIDGETSVIDSGFPRPIEGNWNGLPATFTSGIDAALWRESNDKIYFFKDGQYVRFTDVSAGMDAGYPKPLSLSLTDLESAWLTLPLQEMGYTGATALDDYVTGLRDDYGADTAFTALLTRWPVWWVGYAQYPRVVIHLDVDGWTPANFDRVFAHETGHIFGAPDEYAASGCRCDAEYGNFYRDENTNCEACNPESLDCLMKQNTWGFCWATPYHLGWGPFLRKIDAAFWRGSNDDVYLFSDHMYARYGDVANGIDEGYPRTIALNWIGIPATYNYGIDAAFWNETNGKIYFFKGDSYLRIDGETSTMDVGYPKPIAPNWSGLPANFTEGIDAAFWRESNNKVYLFKDSEYVRLDPKTFAVDAGYPKPIAGNWVGLPSSFTSGIDAALLRRDNHKIYFFKGTQYARLDGETSVMDAGYPAWIDQNWMPFPR